MPASPPPAEVVRHAFAARAQRDFAALGECFAPNARWRTVVDSPYNCENRQEIIATMRRNNPVAPDDEIAEMHELGGRVAVGFHPGPRRDVNPRRLDQGVVWIVATVSDGLIVELKACAGRAEALDYARAD